jgi:hypothetical protein
MAKGQASRGRSAAKGQASRWRKDRRRAAARQGRKWRAKGQASRGRKDRRRAAARQWLAKGQASRWGERTGVARPLGKAEGGSDTHDPHDPRETRRIKVAPRMGFQTSTIPTIPGGSDTHDPHDPRETRRIKVAPRMWSFSVGYLTRQVDLILLTSTVIVDMISVMKARRCFRSLASRNWCQFIF